MSAGLDRPGIRAFTDSIAFVVQTIRRISVSKRRNGVNSSQAFSHSFTIAGYFRPQASANSANRSRAASSVGAVQTSFRSLAILSQSWRPAQRKEFRSRCTTQVCTIVRDQTVSTASGRPLSPMPLWMSSREAAANR